MQAILGSERLQHQIKLGTMGLAHFATVLELSDDGTVLNGAVVKAWLKLPEKDQDAQKTELDPGMLRSFRQLRLRG